MKYLLILATLLVTGCATGSPRGVHKIWHVHPEDMSQFKIDQRRCFEVAAIARGDERLSDSCLQRIGYRLEIVNN